MQLKKNGIWLPCLVECLVRRGLIFKLMFFCQLNSDMQIRFLTGANHLRNSEALTSILEKQKKDGKAYAAICAAPAVVLAPIGLLEEGATCYPAPQFREKLTNPSDDEVVVTGKLTTSKGPGTALKFALELGEQLFGKEARDKIQNEMLA
jgi:4-methyl-5(b-hydroxyethyl)-thiazole monophosphate biosynthesis